MADTLQNLAGAQWVERDVISAFTPVIPAENAVLDNYVFLPYARSGVAAALAEPFDWTKPARGSVTMSVPVIDDRGTKAAEMVVNVFGPGDVTELDTRQVIRTWPRADAAERRDRRPRPDRVRPAGAALAVHAVQPRRRSAGARGSRWSSPRPARSTWGEVRGSTRAATIRRDQLQSLDDAWAWAHAQVMGPKGTPDSLAQRSSGANAPFNLSRLLCPRRLAANTAYIACVVPTFLAGAQAGLGLTPVDVLTPAWSNEDPDAEIALPVYYSWSFGTGEAGNFESLARKILSQPAPAGVGRRRVDATRPWPDAELTADDPGAEMIVLGPIVSLADPALDTTESLADRGAAALGTGGDRGADRSAQPRRRPGAPTGRRGRGRSAAAGHPTALRRHPSPAAAHPDRRRGGRPAGVVPAAQPRPAAPDRRAGWARGSCRPSRRR